MFCRNPIALFMLASLALVGRLPAQTTAPGAAPANVNTAVAPYIDDQTLLVAHIDMDRVDPAAIEKFVTTAFDDAKLPADSVFREDLPAAKLASDSFLALFKQVGGRHIYIVLAHADIYPSASGPALLLPVEPRPAGRTVVGGEAPGARAQQLVDLIKKTVNANDVVCVPLKPELVYIGSAPTLERIRHIQPQARKDLALAAAGNLAAEIVIAPTADEQRAFRELMPTLPAFFGGATTDDLTRAVQNESIQLTLPPDPHVTLTFHVGGAAGGQEVTSKLARAIESTRDNILANSDFDKELQKPEFRPMAQDIRALIKEVLTPKVEGGGVTGFGGSQFVSPSTVTLSLDDRQLRTAIRLMIPALDAARERARRMQVMSDIRQNLVAILLYANDNGGRLPQSLDLVAKNSPYTYRRWADTITGIRDAATTPLLWEQSTDINKPLAVGFADGHSEIVANKAELDALVKKTEEVIKPPLPRQMP